MCMRYEERHKVGTCHEAMWDALVAEAVIKPSLRCRTVSMSWVRDGDEVDNNDGQEDGELGKNTEAVRARRGMHRTKRRETRFILWGKEWTLSGPDVPRDLGIYSAARLVAGRQLVDRMLRPAWLEERVSGKGKRK